MIRNILIVEDAPQVAGILVSKLTREGHAVHWVRTKSAAHETLLDKSYDLILISTYLLPERNAWTLLEEIVAGKISNAADAQVSLGKVFKFPTDVKILGLHPDHALILRCVFMFCHPPVTGGKKATSSLAETG